jgi:hypothetical protein
MHQRNVTDMWAPVLPTREVMTHVADNYPEAQLGYFRVFSNLTSTSTTTEVTHCD